MLIVGNGSFLEGGRAAIIIVLDLYSYLFGSEFDGAIVLSLDFVETDGIAVLVDVLIGLLDRVKRARLGGLGVGDVFLPLGGGAEQKGGDSGLWVVEGEGFDLGGMFFLTHLIIIRKAQPRLIRREFIEMREVCPPNNQDKLQKIIENLLENIFWVMMGK